MKNKQKWLLLAVLISGGIELCAQEIALPAGGEATGIGGSQSFSVGQVFYYQISSSTGSMHQGVQQAYVISTSIDNPEMEIQLELTAYPNPTRGYLNLKIEGDVKEVLEFKMIDLTGQILDTGVAENGISIHVQEYAASTYFLQISNSTKVIKTFRIIKN